jgi:hypothetical protein
LCAWKKDASLSAEREAGNICLKDISDSAARACVAAKEDLLRAKKELGL